MFSKSKTFQSQASQPKAADKKAEGGPLCTVNESAVLAARAKGKIKDFQHAFDKSDALKGINAANGVVQQRCARIKLICAWIVTVGVLAAGLTLIIYACIRIRQFAGATEGKCRIQDYSAGYNGTFNPLHTWRDLCAACKFMVQMRTKDQLVYVSSWTMEFESGHQSGKAEVVDDQFKCCQTQPVLDCCNFYEYITGTFCDNYGEKVDDGCPTAPWPCYVIDLKEKLAEAELSGNPMPPENLKYGELGGEKILLIIGIVLFVAGFIALNFVAPCIWWAFRWLIGAKNAARVDACLLYLAKRCPYRTKKWKRRIRRIEAATTIQRWFRQYMPEIRRKNQTLRITQVSDNGPLTMVAMASDEVEIYETEEVPGAEWKKQDAGDKILIANRVHKKIQEAKQNPQINVPLVHPPEASYCVGKRLLYDTGSAGTSRKLATHRVISDPSSKVQKIEVALLEESTIKELRKVLYLPHKNSNDTRPKITRIPNGNVLQTLGLVPGHRLTKVGKLAFPSFDGAQLMNALIETPRPVFMIFEGATPPFKNPSWAEEWQKQHVQIPLHNPPWTQGGQTWQKHPPNQRNKQLARKILPLENVNAYVGAFDGERKASASSLRESANPAQDHQAGRMRTRSLSLSETDPLQPQHERDPLPPSANPPAMILPNRR